MSKHDKKKDRDTPNDGGRGGWITDEENKAMAFTAQDSQAMAITTQEEDATMTTDDDDDDDDDQKGGARSRRRINQKTVL